MAIQLGKRGQVQFVRSTLRAVPANWTCPLFPSKREKCHVQRICDSVGPGCDALAGGRWGGGGFAAILFVVVLNYWSIWFQAYMSSANISLLSLIGMSFRRVDARVIVQAKIMAVQAGVGLESLTGVSTRRLEAHYLAGGSVPNVIKAIIAAHRADIDLDFDRAAAIDLAGRDVLDAVQTSVYPKVIDCPDPKRSQRTTLSAIAKNGVELKVRAG